MKNNQNFIYTYIGQEQFDMIPLLKQNRIKPLTLKSMGTRQYRNKSNNGDTTFKMTENNTSELINGLQKNTLVETNYRPQTQLLNNRKKNPSFFQEPVQGNLAVHQRELRKQGDHMKFASGFQSPILYQSETNYKFSPNTASQSHQHKGLNSKFLKKLDNIRPKSNAGEFKNSENMTQAQHYKSILQSTTGRSTHTTKKEGNQMNEDVNGISGSLKLNHQYKFDMISEPIMTPKTELRSNQKFNQLKLILDFKLPIQEKGKKKRKSAQRSSRTNLEKVSNFCDYRQMPMMTTGRLSSNMVTSGRPTQQYNEHGIMTNFGNALKHQENQFGSTISSYFDQKTNSLMSSTIRDQQIKQFFKKTNTAIKTNRSKSTAESRTASSFKKQETAEKALLNKYNQEYQFKKKEFIRTNLLRMRASTIQLKESNNLKKVPQSEQNTGEELKFNVQESYYYQNQNSVYKTMSNRLRILHKNHQKFNKMRIYTNKNIQKYFNTFNPLQKFNRIKVIPIERIGYITPGKNPNYYFLMAAKQALVNDLTLAIETTNKGLTVNPQHLFCRFLHGVLMYKLGLLVDAESDFNVVTILHPKEIAGHYNQALCLFQMGRYFESETILKNFFSGFTGSLRALNTQIEINKNSSTHQYTKKEIELIQIYDFELIRDMYILLYGSIMRTYAFNKGEINFDRQDNEEQDALSDKCMLFINNYEIMLNSQKHVKVLKAKDLDKILYDMQLNEIKMDIKEAFLLNESTRSHSQPQSLAVTSVGDKKQKQIKKRNTIKVSGRNGVLNPISFTFDMNLRNLGRSETVDSFTTEDYEDGADDYEKVELQGVLLNSKNSNKKMNYNKIFLQFKNNLLDRVKNNGNKVQAIQAQKLQKIEQDFYEQLRREQINFIDKGYGNLRFHNIYSYLLQPATSKIEILKEKLIRRETSHEQITQNNVVKSGIDNLKRRGTLAPKLHNRVSLRDVKGDPMVEGEDKDNSKIRRFQALNDLTMSQKERDLIENRFQLEEWTFYDPDNGTKDANIKQMQNMRIQDKMYELDKSLQKDKQNNISDKMLFEIHYQKNSIKLLSHYQNELQRIIKKFNQKIDQITIEINSDISIDDRKIFNSKIQDQLEKYQEETANSRDNDYNKKFVEFLKKNLNEQQAGEEGLDKFNTCFKKYSEDVRKHKIKLDNERLDMKKRDQQSITRFTYMQMNLIQNEYIYKKPDYRNVEVLELMTKGLKCMQNYNQKQRSTICKMASFKKVEPNEVIYEEGEVQDCQYIILKGRLAFEKKQPHCGNLPIVISLIADGEGFGQLCTDKNFDETNPKFLRQQSCIAVEETFLLTVSKNTLWKIENAPSTWSKLTVKVNHRKDIYDDIDSKIDFIKTVDQFAGIENRAFLTSICQKIKKETYQLGDIIINEGDVPQQIYMLKEGQCKVILRDYGERRLALQNTFVEPIKKITIKNDNMPQTTMNLKQDPLFNNFNPQNSVLNRINFMQKSYQNNKVNIDNEGKEIKWKINFEEQQEFSKLRPGNSFGGRSLVAFDQYLHVKENKLGFDAVKRKYKKGTTKKQIDEIKAQGEKELENYFMKSLLSIVADTATVEIWTLDRQCLVQALIDNSSTLTENETKQIQDNIILSTDGDRQNLEEGDVDFMRKQFKKWDRYKQQYIEGIYEQRNNSKFYAIDKRAQ